MYNHPIQHATSLWFAGHTEEAQKALRNALSDPAARARLLRTLDEAIEAGRALASMGGSAPGSAGAAAEGLIELLLGAAREASPLGADPAERNRLDIIEAERLRDRGDLAGAVTALDAILATGRVRGAAAADVVTRIAAILRRMGRAAEADARCLAALERHPLGGGPLMLRAMAQDGRGEHLAAAGTRYLAVSTSTVAPPRYARAQPVFVEHRAKHAVFFYRDRYFGFLRGEAWAVPSIARFEAAYRSGPGDGDPVVDDDWSELSARLAAIESRAGAA